MAQTETRERKLSDEESRVIKTLLYFDIFNHPLRHDEIYWFAGNGEGKNDFEIILQQLVAKGMIQSSMNHYYLYDKWKNVSERNNERPRLKKYFKMARLMASLVATFPFVRGVFLSGSLSKYRASAKSDIDFFIVTEPGRLWIARTMLMLFKKVFLFNSYKYFCLNYFIDTNSLTITSRNRYIATEIATLIPAYNPTLYRRFMSANSWIKDYFPLCPQKEEVLARQPFSRFLQRLMEFFLNNKVGDRLDDFLMTKTLKYRKRKFSYMDEDTFNASFYTQKNSSKHHPVDYKKLVMDKLETQLRDFESVYNIKLQ